MFQNSNQWLTAVFDMSIKSLILVFLIWLSLKLLRIRDSNLKHRIWSGALVGMLTLPLMSYVLPTIPVNVSLQWADAKGAKTSPTRIVETSSPANEFAANELSEIGALAKPVVGPAMESSVSSSTEAPATMPVEATPTPIVETKPKWATSDLLKAIPAALFFVWVAVAACLAVRLLIGLWSAIRIARRAVLVVDEVASRTTLPISRTSIRETSEASVPVTIGLFRPTVLLPADWRKWPLEKLEAIIAHEFTHVARRDFLVTLAAEVNRCLYWFHPVSWWLRKRLSDLAEEVCDDAAIGQTGDPIGYAKHLLEVAAQVGRSTGRVIQPGLAMAMRSNVESRIATILDSKRPRSRRLSLKAVTLVVLIVFPIVVSTAALRAAAQSSQAKLPVVGQEPSKPPSDASEEMVRVHGQVTDIDGKPMPNATIRLYGVLTQGYYALPGDFTLVRTLKLDDKARFDESVPMESLIRPTEKKFPKVGYTNLGAWSTLVVSAPGHGYEFVKGERVGRTFNGVNRWMPSFMAGPVTIKMRKAEPIRGHVLGLEGQPISGAIVSVYKLAHHDPSRFDKWLERVPKKPIGAGRATMAMLNGNDSKWSPDFPTMNTFEMPPKCVEPVVSNREGRFELPNLAGPNDVVILRVRGKGIVDRLIHVVARDMKPVFGRSVMRSPNASTFYGRNFGYIAQPSLPIQGVVRDIATKRPLSNVVVSVGRIYGRMAGRDYIITRTDAQGRYRIEGLPLQPKGLNRYKRNNIAVQPGDLPYIANKEFPVPDSSGTSPIELNIEMRRAVLAKGRITDENGKPVAAKINYAPFATNDHTAEYARFSSGVTSILSNEPGRSTNANGEFEIPVIPGRGVLVARTRSNVRIAGFGSDLIKEFQSKNNQRVTTGYDLRPSNYHSLREIDVPTGKKSIDVAMRVQTGRSITIHFRGPDGKPLTDVMGKVSGAIGKSIKTTGTTATVSGLGAGKAWEMMFATADQKLQRIVHVTPRDGVNKIEVVLFPPTHIKGRLIDLQGRPVADTTLSRSHRHEGALYMEMPFQIEKDGRFDCTIAVGAVFEIRGKTDKYFYVVKDFNNNKPMSVELGDLVVDPDADRFAVLKAKKKPIITELNTN